MNGELTFAKLLDAFGQHYKPFGKDIKTNCPNTAGHKRGDRNPSCFCIEAENSNIGKAGFHCFACGIKGTIWDFTARLMGLPGYQGYETEIRGELIRRRIIIGSRKQNTKLVSSSSEFNERAIWFCAFPLLFEKLQIRDALLLSTVIYYVRLNCQKYNHDSWNCSMKKIREKFLPFFTKTTLWRSVSRLQELGLLSAFTNHRTTNWQIHFETLQNIQRRSFLNRVDSGFHTETTETTKRHTNRQRSRKDNASFSDNERFLKVDELGFHGETEDATCASDSIEISNSPVAFSQSAQNLNEKNKKKEFLTSNKYLSTLDKPVYENARFQNETQWFHHETSGREKTGANFEIAVAEADPQIQAFQKIFGGVVCEHSDSPSIPLTSNTHENGKRLLAFLGEEYPNEW